MHRLTPVVSSLVAIIVLVLVSAASAAATATVKFRLVDQWNTGFQGKITLKNKSASEMGPWQLEFKLPHNITSIWDAEIVSRTGKRYVIRGVDWNKNLPPHGKISFGFIADQVGNYSPPKKCKLDDIAVDCQGKNPPPTKAPTKTPKLTNTPTKTATSTRTMTRTLTPTVGPSPTPGGSGNFPARFFAPYVDVLMWPTPNIAQIAQQTGTKYYTLAFIVSGTGCSASWGGVIPLADNFYKSEINALRQAGGDVIVSFGGANGVELAQSCTTVSALQAQYQAVIDKYNLTHIDLDIEGAAIADTASVDRRNRAVAALQANARAQNKTLNISYTLPVMPSGLTWQGVELLENAVQNGVDISTVNIMAMDYGGVDPNNMGDHAVSAMTSLHTQLGQVYPNKSNAQRWHMVGVTPMIGLNDVHPEVFTLKDANKVLEFSQQKNISRIAFWSTGRDKSCPNNGAYVASDCSGIVQAPWDFSKIFKVFTP